MPQGSLDEFLRSPVDRMDSKVTLILCTYSEMLIITLFEKNNNNCIMSAITHSQRDIFSQCVTVLSIFVSLVLKMSGGKMQRIS